MSGFLSQAIANMVAAEQQVRSLSGLPPEAQKIQRESVAVISPTVSHIQTMQKAVSSFVEVATPQLNNIKAMVGGNLPIPIIKVEMANVQKEAGALKSTVDGIAGQVNAASSQVLSYFGQLATIESGLTTRMTTLQGQLGDARGEEEATRKKYYWLIALGPFGLIGLAVALGLYLKWKSEVNGYESQISALNTQIRLFTAMKSACHAMESDFQGVVTKISGVENSVGFLTGDLLSISSDLDSGSTLTVIDIMVTAAITEVTTLGIDAS
jgi:hypothetical protein